MRSTLLVLALLTAAPLAAASFSGQSPPNDPNYAPVEAGGADTCFRFHVNDEQHYLYSFMPRCAPHATDPEGAAGMSVDLAWKRTIGSPDVVIAYVEGGINWHDNGARDLVDQVFLNRAELPLPAGSLVYDANGDGVLNIQDYATDARVVDTNGNGYKDAEDLIVAFSDGVDDDHNGFTDDISGWDFYDDQNDPATVDSTYGHANGQMRQAAAEANNALMGAGVCPGCRILPIKAGAEALDRTDDLAQAWLYAGRIGASVIVSVTADLGYSSAMGAAIEKLWNDGVVMVEASNDFDSTDHQGGMWWPHVLPGNGLVTNTQGTSQANSAQGSPTAFAANQATTTFRERAGYTSWGTHNMFSVATSGGTTSESTPTVGGVMGLVLSRGRTLSPPLSGPEAVQVVRATASDIDDAALAWPSAPGWDLQYGYGRPNVAKAFDAIDAGAIPPVASLDSPQWYALVDPATSPLVPVTGHVSARGGLDHWVLEWAPGAEPTDAAFTTAATGTGPLVSATVDLSTLPASFWAAPYSLSTTKTLESTERYTVTLRLRAYDAAARMGEDRRSIAAHHDDAMLPGFPRAIGSSGESQPALVPMQGTVGIVFGDADGRVHALDGRTGLELPGWPATTDAVQPHAPVAGIDFGHEPILAPVAAGDLGHGLRIVVATTSGHVDVYDAFGARVQRLDASLGAVTPPIPRPALPLTRLPHAGTSASPVLVDLDGDGALDIVQASWDGRLYAWREDGTSVAGAWPLRVAFAGALAPGHILVNDSKLVTTPAVADLDGDGAPEIVVESQMTEVTATGLQPLGLLHVYAFHRDGSLVAGWPATLPAIVEYYGSAQEFITEASTAPASADVDHDGKDEVAVTPVFSPTFLLDGAGRIRAVYGPWPNALEAAFAGAVPTDLARGSVTGDAPVGFTTSGAFGKLGGVLAYAQPGSTGASLVSSLLLPGSGSSIHNVERAYDAATGAQRPGYPATAQGLNFLGAPILADVDGDHLADLIDGGDSSTMHAYGAAGTPVAGWPRFTTGWTLFSPSAGDVDGDGHTDIVTVTREGYVLAWSTPGDASVVEWPTYHADVQRTGHYGGPILPPLGAASVGAAWLPVLGIGALALFRRR